MPKHCIVQFSDVHLRVVEPGAGVGVPGHPVSLSVRVPGGQLPQPPRGGHLGGSGQQMVITLNTVRPQPGHALSHAHSSLASSQLVSRMNVRQ